MSFEVIPAIDLLDGACVRLTQGRYDDATVYERDPGAQAARFTAHAIPRLHVVDLDGAKAGRPVTRPRRSLPRRTGRNRAQGAA